MAPQGDIPPAATVLGTIGTIFWCIQLIPQIWTNHRRRNTEGFPASMMFLWAASGVPFGIYAIVQRLNVPLQCQAQIFTALSLMAWGQCLYYGHAWGKVSAVVVPVVAGVVFAGIEAGVIFGIRGPYERGDEKPIMVVGIVAAILLAAGLLPPYKEIWKRRGRVVGINFLFLTIDSLGALFSLMSLVAQHTFDILGAVQYASVLILEIGIFSCHFIWLARRWWKEKYGLAVGDPEQAEVGLEKTEEVEGVVVGEDEDGELGKSGERKMAEEKV